MYMITNQTDIFLHIAKFRLPLYLLNIFNTEMTSHYFFIKHYQPQFFTNLHSKKNLT